MEYSDRSVYLTLAVVSKALSTGTLLNFLARISGMLFFQHILSTLGMCMFLSLCSLALHTLAGAFLIYMCLPTGPCFAFALRGFFCL